MEGMEGAGSRRQDTFGLREIGLNLSTTTGDAQSMMYTADASVDTVMAPLGVHTGRDAAGSGIGKKLAAAKKKVTRYFPGKAPKWVKSNEDDDVKAFGAPRRRPTERRRSSWRGRARWRRRVNPTRRRVRVMKANKQVSADDLIDRTGIFIYACMHSSSSHLLHNNHSKDAHHDEADEIECPQ